MVKINQETQNITNETANALTQTHTSFIPSGYEQIDQTFGGWREHGVSVLAYRPGMGSTVFMMNSAIEKATNGSKVLFISQKLTVETFFGRLISKLTQIPVIKMTNPSLMQTEELEQIKQFNTSTVFCSLKDTLYFVETYSTEDLQSIIATHQESYGVDTVYLDFGITDDVLLNELIRLSSEQHVSFVINQQLKRHVEKRADKRPILLDLQGLETFKDVVDFYGFYRDELYDADTTNPNQLEIFTLGSEVEKSVKLPVDFTIQTVYQ